MGNENSTQSVGDSNESPSRRRDQITSRGPSAASNSSSSVDWVNVAAAATAITAVGAACYAAYAYDKGVKRDQENKNEFSDLVRASLLVEESQDNKRHLGYFKCHNCKHEWKSAFAWDNYGQKCKECLGDYLRPYKTERLSELERKKNSKPHPEDLCEKCRVHGRPCYKW